MERFFFALSCRGIFLYNQNMARKIYISLIVLLLGSITVLNFYAYKFFWYWRFWWFDIIMHTLGGLFVGLIALGFYFLRPNTREREIKTGVAFAVAFALISVIGVGWELFEFSTKHVIFLPQHDPWNTASDLFFDGVGCAFAVFIFLVLYNKRISPSRS